jgi:hypothetical protein
MSWAVSADLSEIEIAAASTTLGGPVGIGIAAAGKPAFNSFCSFI